MKILVCETYSSIRKEYITLPENFDIALKFIKNGHYDYLKVSFQNEEGDDVFASHIVVRHDLSEVVESIKKQPTYNPVMNAMLEEITKSFQEILASSNGNIIVFDIDNYIDEWCGWLTTQLEDYTKKHFK